MGVGVMVIGAVAFFSFHVWSLGFGLIPIAVTLLIVGWAISLFVIGLVLAVRDRRRGAGVGSDVRAAARSRASSTRPTALPEVMQPIAVGAAHDARVQRVAGPRRRPRSQLDAGNDRRDGSVVMLLFVAGFLVHMLTLFRKRGYITRYT